ncbi:biotin--[acetyl-CoA-carboxylase] ligase [Flavobacterium cellulosilyticum]|uniref:Biotin--[acetyl-CoA-carboxylase] ligase n=1 Tax=Flavobacterium cellulosilyticum TaxID=2541731 RepID=A0A4R5C9B9_9FLAO|nr:biotin--[acetyl-CoA-carboxylase] ligase [Flavobacterium cellulosilyticum]TDD95246.1 biotin--[acetyl-CoA-carboxylase] ligase [Flavobacterium cellulosilyticum]
MKLIKLDAIDSTNDFLKGLSNNQSIENFTVVTAESQTKGKGQMGSVWVSEKGKNLTMSVLVNDYLSDISAVFDINIAVSISIIQVLKDLHIPKLSIKWPNDIMSYNKKIGGILIENSIKSNGTIHSIVGIGLNINQTDFTNLPKASSLAKICSTTFDKEKILLMIVEKLKQNIQFWNVNAISMWAKYSDNLFKKGIPMTFLDKNEKYFMGIIQGVSTIGKLEVLLENDSVSDFDIKEIQMLY